MNFINPIGLLGLIGIPVLILIYIIKSKYKEHNISSTYIWKLSERFLKKKSPLSKLSGILSLILQILAVLFLSLSLAHPIISVLNSAKNYVLIVDTSASMNMSTKIQEAKQSMNSLVDKAKNNSEFSIILADEEAIVLLEKETDKEKIRKAINSITASYTPSSVSNGLQVAQNYFDEDNSVNVILYTDNRYLSTNNIEVVSVGNDEYNASINSLYYIKDETTITFKGEVISFNEDKTLKLDLLIDNQYNSSIIVNAIKDELMEFETTIDLIEFNEAKVIISQNDSLDLDNQYCVFANEAIDKYNVLLVSEKPFYIKTILSSISDVSIDVRSTYSSQTGYDLYVFDGISPTSLPTDGSIWLFNISKNIENAGFSVQEVVDLSSGGTLKLTDKDDEIYNVLTNNLMNNTIYISKYVHYSVYHPFTTIMTYNNVPIIFAGENESGNRQVTFAFDLSTSNFPLLLDFIILFNNMVSYSLPSICDQSFFVCGDELLLNVLPKCSSIRINSPSNKPSYLQIDSSIITYKLKEVGVYEIVATIDNKIKTFKLYASFPLQEASPTNELESIEIIGNKNNISYASTYDIQWILFILVLVICLLEWGVYLYEQRDI